MKECIIDALIDTLKLLPYLLITFLLLELLEHKLSKRNEKILSKTKKGGPIIGSILGALPQCGFSSMAAELFSSRVIIMISEKVSILLLLKIIGFKVLVGITIGFLIDLLYKKNKKEENHIHELCEHDHCDCEHDGVFLASIKHTLQIGLFILIANLIISIIIFKIGENNLSNILLHKNFLTYFIASLIGLIPNCAGSVIITELYLSKLISIGNLLSGLLTGSGLGILLLFKTNKNIKENLSILSIIYLVGVIVGIIVDIVL